MLSSVFSDITSAYMRVFRNPLVFFLYLFAIIECIELALDRDPDIISQMLTILHDVDKSSSGIRKSLVAMFIWLFKILDSNKFIIMSQLLIWIPYFFSETDYNLAFSFVFSVFSYVFIRWSMLETLIYSQLWFLYSEVELNVTKMLIVCFVYVVYSFDQFDLSVGSNNHKNLKAILASFPKINLTKNVNP